MKQKQNLFEKKKTFKATNSKIFFVQFISGYTNAIVNRSTM